jgi:hypothetical protein
MEPNAALVAAVQGWVAADDKLKGLQKEVRTARSEKQQLTGQLRQLMADQDVEAVDLGTSSIVPTARKTKAPLSKKYLIACMSRLFPEDAPLAERITTHILDNREIRVAEGVRRTPEKK